MANTPNSIITPQTPNTPTLSAVLSTAMTSTKAYDGTETTATANTSVYTVGANGGKLPDLKLKFGSTAGLAPSGTTNATVANIWINNGATNATSTNNALWGSVTIPSITYTNTGAMPEYIYSFNNLALPAGYKVFVGITTAVGGTNCAIIPTMIGGGDF